ncbi:hypothetical protein Tco_1408366 [Tanacetum coccineum]
MFILRCRREIAEDLRLAREINALCARLTAVIDERENFKEELNVLAGRLLKFKRVHGMPLSFLFESFPGTDELSPGMSMLFPVDSSVVANELVVNMVVGSCFPWSLQV